jgi:probable HAF family extracellular repeat protein
MPSRFPIAMRALFWLIPIIIVAEKSSAAMYSVTDLGSLPGDNYSYAEGINDSGQIVGYSYVNGGPSAPNGRPVPSEGVYHAFLYTNDQMTDLGTLGGTQSIAYGIDNAGQIVGAAFNSAQNSHAFLYAGGIMNDLGTLGGPNSYATAVNAAGQITGYSDLTGSSSGDSLYHAFLYTGGQLNDLGILSPYTDSNGVQINSSGQIIGGLYSTSLDSNSFLYNNGGMTNLTTVTSLAAVTAFNDHGQYTGYKTSGQSYIYQNGSLTYLGSPDGFDAAMPYAINNSGQIVGALETGGTSFNAFIWSNGLLSNLNSDIEPSSGWTLQEATAINDNGQIVGYGLNPSGDVHGFLLTPVPEPSATALILLMTAGLTIRGRKQPSSSVLS